MWAQKQPQRQQMVFFYSAYCKYCAEFARLLKQTRYANAFVPACIDPVPGTNKRPAWVKRYQQRFLTQVPCIVIGNQVYLAKAAFQWLGDQTGVRTRKELEGGSDIASFKADEMSGFADQFAFLDGTMTQGEYVSLEKAPPLQKNTGPKISEMKLPRGAQLPDPVGPRANWSAGDINIPKPKHRPNFKQKDYAIDKEYLDPAAFKPVRPHKQIDFRLPQLDTGRKDDFRSVLDQRMQTMQMERDMEFAPQPTFNGSKRTRKYRDI